MTMTENAKCEYCRTAPAAGIKTEIEREWSEGDGGREVEIRVERKICDGCEEHLFDGTEEHPGIAPLA